MQQSPGEYAMWLERAETGKNVDQLQRTYDKLLQSVKRIDPLTLADMSAAVYKGDGVPRIILPFLHSWFVLEFLPYRLTGQHAIIDTLPLKALVLQHLMCAAENEGGNMRVTGKWIDCRSLVHGAVMGAHFAGNTARRLAAFFALSQEKRAVRMLKWGGRPMDVGDEGYLFRFFPNLPIAFIHWRGDEEFPSHSKALFDESASNYMTTHGIAVLTDFLASTLAYEED